MGRAITSWHVPFSFPPCSSTLPGADRPDMRAHRQSVAAAEHDIKLQRANAWPELKVTGGWDKNGSIGRNFFAVGIGLTLPVFNQNQGNIRAARSTRKAPGL